MAINKVVLFVTVFLSGAAVMVLELIGLRFFAPYFGTTIDVFTSIISVVLAALSIGYCVGGKIADKRPKYVALIFDLFLASFITIVSFSFINEILTILTNSNISNRITVFLASLILLGPINFLLGIISPYAIKLGTSEIKKLGTASGKFYAVGTMGSIFGTVITGLVLIPTMGINYIVYFVGLTLFLLALFISLNKVNFKIIMLIIALFILLTINFFRGRSNKKFLLEVDSQYQHISIFDFDKKTGNNTTKDRLLFVNRRCCQSGMALNKPNELMFDYTKYFTLGESFFPDAKNYLVLGGGGYSFPKYLLANYPNITVDVVEIDPIMTEIAKNYFYLKSDKRLRIFTEDGRVFLNRNTKKYDAIIVDVFNDQSIPFSATTKEIINTMNNRLVEDGLVIVNIVSAFNGPQSLFFRSEYSTYSSIFPKIYVYQVDSKNVNKMQNIILVALKNKNQTTSNLSAHLYKNMGQISSGFVLTDNYAPVENMFIK